MTSITSSSHVNVAVLGAGLSGLTAAYYAKRSNQSVRLIEASSRAGGSIRSEKKDGFLLEWGPNTVLPTAEMMDLVHELDLSNQLLLGDPKLPRFIQFNGKLQAVPMTFKSLLKTKLLSNSGRFRLLAEPFIKKSSRNGDESLLDFAKRRFGPEVAHRLVAPFVCGVWAGDPEQLSAASAFPKLSLWEKNKGSVFWGMVADKKSRSRSVPRGLLSFVGGMETLTQSLLKKMEEDTLLNASLTSITPEVGRWTLSGPDFQFTADKLILSVPADQAAKLISTFSKESAQALNEIPYAPLAVLHLAVKPSDVKSDLHAFGHLIAPSENLETLGCLYSSSIFSNRAPKDTALLTVFVGGARFPHALDLSDQEILKKAVTALQAVMGLQKHPELLALIRYPRAIPQYTIGHEKRMEVLRQTEEKFPLRFAGNYVGGISVGDVIRRAKNVL